MQIETWPLSRIIPYEQNAKIHSEESVEKLAVLLQQFGWRQALVVDAEGVLVIGHRRLRAALRLGWTEGPVHVGRDLSPEQIRMLRIADNRVHEDDTWDADLLAEEMKELEKLELDLSLTAFDEDEREMLLSDDEDDHVLFQIETLPLKRLEAHPRAFRTFTEEQLAGHMVNLKKHGQTVNIIVAEDNTVLSGAATVQALENLRRKSVKAQRLDLDPDHPEALKILVRDNAIAARLNDKKLVSVLQEIKKHGSLEGTGYNEAMLKDLVFMTSPKASLKDQALDEDQPVTKDEHWAGMPEYTAEKQTGCRHLIIHFETPEAVENFAQLVSQTITPKTKYLWFPPREKADLASFKFVVSNDTEEDEEPDSFDTDDEECAA